MHRDASPPPRRATAGMGLTPGQGMASVVLIALIWGLIGTHHFLGAIRYGFICSYLLAGSFRLASSLVPPTHAPCAGHLSVTPEDRLPRFTIILALYREAGMVRQLLRAMERIDYPASRIQIIAALERDDPETLAACRFWGDGLGLQFAFGSGVEPRTKPRALNAALSVATGDVVVVYDAEDQPHPGQLREVARIFQEGPANLAVVQAPLRIVCSRGASELERQFALEYAIHFYLTLPFMARLGAPFPLGGTSNHIRRSALLEVGGWDAWNVTEDADMGFRLAAAGYRMTVSTLETLENAPSILGAWVCQRSRWIKGHLQTLGVHSRVGHGMGVGGLCSMGMTLGLGVASAATHGPFLLLILTNLLLVTLGGGRVWLSTLDEVVALGGWGAATLALTIGARRMGGDFGWRSIALAPICWGLQSIAFVRALWQLWMTPYKWDKTEHSPVDIADWGASALDGTAANGLSGRGVQNLAQNRRSRHHPAHAPLVRLRAAGQRRWSQAGALRTPDSGQARAAVLLETPAER